MAKLEGVKTLDMVNGEITKIEYDGSVYEKVDEGMKGDIGLRVKDGLLGQAEVGSFYQISNERYELSYIDEDGDNMTFGGSESGKFAFFRKVSETASPTIEQIGDRLDDIDADVYALAERVDALENGGESAPWKRGDKVRNKYSGRVVEVFAYQPKKRTETGFKFANHRAGFTFLDEFGFEHWDHIEDYDLIEESTEFITFEGEKYALVDRKAQSGDVVYVTKDARDTAAVPNEEYYRVNSDGEIGVDSKWTHAVYRDGFFNRTKDTVKVYEPIAKLGRKPDEYKKGDIAKGYGIHREHIVIGEVVDVSDKLLGVKDGKGYTAIENFELIAPVESRVDNVE